MRYLVVVEEGPTSFGAHVRARYGSSVAWSPSCPPASAGLSHRHAVIRERVRRTAVRGWLPSRSAIVHTLAVTLGEFRYNVPNLAQIGSQQAKESDNGQRHSS